jgi:aerobic carbon-monoxide dehydrogenase medium subunit
MPDIALLHPRTVDEAVQLLAGRDDARAIGGGQTLVAMLNAGLVSVGSLVAMSAIEELSALTRRPDGSIWIGAAVPHRVVAQASDLIGAHMVVREAAGLIAHPAIRNFGTIGGSLAHADPASDYPAAVVAAGAGIEIAGPAGRRRVAAEECFVDYLTSCLAPGELIAAVELPPPGRSSAGHYLKFSRVDGDYATVSVAVTLEEKDGLCASARIALGSCGATPIFDPACGDVLAGSRCEAAAVAKVGELLAARADPIDDVRASSAYRRALIPGLVRRAIEHTWSMLRRSSGE